MLVNVKENVQWPVVSHVILLPRTDKRIFETKAKIVACGFTQFIEIIKIWIVGLSWFKLCII